MHHKNSLQLIGISKKPSKHGKGNEIGSFADMDKYLEQYGLKLHIYGSRQTLKIGPNSENVPCIEEEFVFDLVGWHSPSH